MKTMKNYTIACAVLTAAGFLILALCLHSLPDQVPMHWNFEGVMDRMGSKYEYLIIAAFGPVISAVMLFVTEKCAKQPLERRIVGLTAVFLLFLFFGITFSAIWQGIKYLNGGFTDPVIILKGAGIFVGAVLILLGNVMPKATRNPVVGVRLPWTMDNDRVWQRSQRFGGISAVVCGLLTVVFTLLLPGVLLPSLVLVILPTVWVVSVLAVSWKYAKEEKARPRGMGSSEEG